MEAFLCHSRRPLSFLPKEISVSTISFFFLPRKSKLANSTFLSNIHRPTSAIRGTLTSPTERKQRGVERMRSPPLYSPYSRTSPRRMGVDSSPFHDPPEPSPAVAPLSSPRRIESSTLMALRQRNSPSPHSTHRVPDTPQKSPKNRPVIGLSPSSPRSWRRTSPPPPLRVVTNDESIAAPLSPPIVLPPLWNRKRKRAQFQESSETGPHPPQRIPAVLNPPAGAVRTVQPQSQTPSPIERPSNNRVITAIPVGDYPELYVDSEDPEDERPGKKAKKNVMSWEERRDTMECDPLLGIVEAKRVYCKPCKKWIKLDARNDFYPGLWVKHRKTMHGFSGLGEGHFAPERRRRSGSGGVGVGAGNGGASSRARKTAGNTPRRQDQIQESYQRNAGAATRRVRSSSRITRSSSSSSV